MEFDHLGVVTRDADAAAEEFAFLMDAPIVHEESDEDRRFVFQALETGYVELIEPLGDDGFIAPYLDENGPGIHHFAVRVEDIEATLSAAKAAGVELIDEEPRPGAWGHEIAFVHPRSAHGVLLEYVA